MAAIDGLIETMVQRGGHSLALESHQPSRLLSAEGVASGAVLDEAQVQAMLREVVPPELAPLLRQDGQFNFPYPSPAGLVSILVERRGQATRASVTPAVLPPSAVPAQPAEWNSGAAAQSPYAPSPYGSQPYGSQMPNSAPIPLAYGGPPGAPMQARPSVGCLPALGMSLVCVLAINMVGKGLGVGANIGIVLLSAIGVLLDARSLGVRRGKLQGMADMGPWGWFFACLLLWGIGMPYYILARPLYAQIKDAEDSGRLPVSQ